MKLLTLVSLSPRVSPSLKATTFALLATVALESPGAAQNLPPPLLPPPPDAAQNPPTTLKEIVIGAPPATVPGRDASRDAGRDGNRAANRDAGRAVNHERCVDVEIGRDRSFGCINEQLRQRVDRVNPTTNTPPLDARSPDTKIGVVNMPAVREQYGKNFGVSAAPYRPAAPTFTPSIGHR